MDRGIPTSSKLISKKINDRNREIHLAKLGKIKSTISRAAPQTFSHLKSNKKKVQVYEDRLTEIERENKLLLEKLTTIMKTSNHDQSTDKAFGKSLNRDFRKRELVQITIDNQSLLRRLQDKKSTYDRTAWEKDNRQRQVYLKNISEYPLVIENMKGVTEEDRPSTYQPPRDDVSTIVTPSSMANSNFYATTTSKMGEKTPNKNQNVNRSRNEKLDPVSGTSAQKKILYQSRRKIGFSNYLIHVYLHNDTFNIIASNNERSDFKTLSMSRLEGEELLQQFDENYEELIKSIQFKGSKIVIDNSSTYISTDHRDVAHNQIVEAQDEHEADHEASAQRKQEKNKNTEIQKEERQQSEVKSSKQSSRPESDKMSNPIQRSDNSEKSEVKASIAVKESTHTEKDADQDEEYADDEEHEKEEEEVEQEKEEQVEKEEEEHVKEEKEHEKEDEEDQKKDDKEDILEESNKQASTEEKKEQKSGPSSKENIKEDEGSVKELLESQDAHRASSASKVQDKSEDPGSKTGGAIEEESSGKLKESAHDQDQNPEEAPLSEIKESARLAQDSHISHGKENDHEDDQSLSKDEKDKQKHAEDDDEKYEDEALESVKDN